MGVSPQDFHRAFGQVVARFPFAGYLDAGCSVQMSVLARALARHLPQVEGARLLDVGCGPMDKTAILQALGFRCSAVDDLGDPWHKMGDNAQRIAAFARESGIEFHHQAEGDYTIPFPKAHFDVAMAIDVVEHLHESPRLILNAMGEHLRPGGLLVVVMPNAVNLRKRLSVLFGRTNYNPLGELYHALGSYRGHVREYTLAETRELCALSGFQVVHAETFEHVAQGRLPTPLRQLYLLAGRLVPGLRSGILVIARKPEGWAPRPEDPAAYFRAISSAVPDGLLDTLAGQTNFLG